MRRFEFADDNNILNLAPQCNVSFAMFSPHFVVELRQTASRLKGFFIVKKSWMIGLIAVLLVAACQSSAPLHQFSKGDGLATYDFTGEASFEEGAYGAATLQVIDGVYQIDVMQGDNVLWWGQWGDTYKDTVIDVDTAQQSEPNENAYGVMCRVQGTVGQKLSIDPALAAVLQDSTAEPTV